MDLMQLYDEYIHHYLVGAVKPSTQRLYAARLRAVLEGLKARTTGDLTPLGFMRWRTTRHRSVQANTLNNELRILKVFLNWAVRSGHLERNPLAVVKRLRETEEKARRPLTEEESAALARSSPRGLIWHFLIVTGIRKSEFITLTRRDIDLKNRRVKIRAEVCKTGVGRVIQFPVGLAERLNYQLNGQAPKAPAFTNNRREAWRDNGALLACLRRDVAKLKLDTHGVDLHALRVTCATRLIARGVEPKTVQYILGHKNIQVTLDLYARYVDRFDPKVEAAQEL